MSIFTAMMINSRHLLNLSSILYCVNTRPSGLDKEFRLDGNLAKVWSKRTGLNGLILTKCLTLVWDGRSTFLAENSRHSVTRGYLGVVLTYRSGNLCNALHWISKENFYFLFFISWNDKMRITHIDILLRYQDVGRKGWMENSMCLISSI